MKQRRAFNFYPRTHRTDLNNRETYLIDDPLFEPEQFEYRTGYVGDTGVLTTDDLVRTPEMDASLSVPRQIEQYQIGVAYVDPETKAKSKGAFVSDLVNQIAMNGGIVDDQNRLFSQHMYSWAPPIDYDKFINYSRYYWMAPGDATVNGEYVSKEVSGSMTVVHQYDGINFNRIEVTMVDTLPGSSTVGSLFELSSDPNRPIYEWDGASWIQVIVNPVPDIPTNPHDYNINDYVYIARTGPLFNRPLLWMYSTGAGRWISQAVVVSTTPPTEPHEGTVWEDCSTLMVRKFRKYTAGEWVELTYTTGGAPTGVAADKTTIYDIRKWNSGSHDTWSVNNWWVNQKDLSPVDQSYLKNGDQAIRPIIEFWNGIESVGPARTERNQQPLFKMFKYTTSAISVATETTPIMSYKRGTGRADLVLGFPLSYDSTGEFQFILDLESVETSFLGYRLFRNTQTGFYHSIWNRSASVTGVQTRADKDQVEHYEVAPSIIYNPDHGILTSITRSQVINHMASVIGAQTDGDRLGVNSWRWGSKNLETGASLLDPENSMLLPLSLVQDANLDIPDAIRYVEKEYSRFWARFTRRVNEMWNKASIVDGSGTLYSLTPSQVVDVVLTDLFVDRNDQYPYHKSDMGTWVETRLNNNIPVVIDSTPRPIYVPASPARIGCSPAFEPTSFEEQGKTYLRGHDGSIIESFGDDRDLVWISIHQRMFARIDSSMVDETLSVTSRHGGATYLQDFYGGFYPNARQIVVEVVNDYNDVVSPTLGQVYASRLGPVYASWDGVKWGLIPMTVDDVFYDIITDTYYIYNEAGIFEINTFNHLERKLYSTTEFRRIIRREFERWVVGRNLDYVANKNFSESDPFTWNYASAGMEGHYRGIYRRLYHTVRPHSHPWEVMGYSIEPDWWRTEYVPTSTASDGTPRYAATHPMWDDFQSGLVHPALGITKTEFSMLASVPVDSDGELIDPITAGIIDELSLDPRRLNDTWVFGDGGDVEEEFYNSTHYVYACALAGYLMQPLEWIATKWDDQAFYLDGLFSGPHYMRKDTLRRNPISQTLIHLDPNPVIGLNMWIADRIRALGMDVTEGYSKVVRNTQPFLAWKTYGYINPERTVYGLLSGKEIPYEDASVVTFKSRPTSSEFGSGIYIIREDTGYRVYGFDYNNPFFRIETPDSPVSGQQVEKKQYFVADINQHSYVVTNFSLPTKTGDTTKVAIIVNGMKLRPEFVRIVDSQTIEINSAIIINGGEEILVSTLQTVSSSNGAVKQFSVGGVNYFYFSAGSGTYIDVPYGTYFPGANEVINFMIGYGRYLSTRGWQYEEYQEGDIEVRDFLFGAKQFATWLSEITNPRIMRVTQQTDFDSFYFSPFNTSARFDAEFGHMDTVEAIQNGLYGVINKRGEPIPPAKLDVLRIGNGIKITSTQPPVREGENEIYGVRVNISEAQHVVFFSQRTRFGQIIYDPVLGIFQPTLRVATYRTSEWLGRYDAPGYLISENTLLPNLEKQATDFTRYYDRTNPVDDPVKREQAWNLYGYYPMDSYMDQIGADERSRFDYYRGMIHAKGTIRAINAYAKGTRAGLENIQVYEDWLWKLTEYGDVNREEVQFRVYHTDFYDKIQTIRFGTDSAGSRALTIPDLDRTHPETNSRWLIPSKTTNNLISTFRFPTVNGAIDYQNSYSLKLIDSETNQFILDHTLFDPLMGKFDRKAMSLVNFKSYYDPALYNVGPKAASSNSLTWGSEKVGQTWWRLGTALYSNYKGLLPYYELAASEWGRMKYANATIVQVGDTITISLFDPVTGQPFPHGATLNNSILISISGANQPDYNMEQVYGIASSSTQIQMTISNTVGNGTGNIVVQIGHIEVMEWVESPVPPDQWAQHISKLPDTEKVSGEAMFVNNPSSSASYSVYEAVDANGRVNRKYYFWVKSYTKVNNRRDLTTAQIARRLENPTREGVPWFAPVNDTSLFVYSGGEKVKDTYSFAVSVDARKNNTHDEWILITENDRFKNPPIQVEDKILDCLAHRDKFGNPVPDPYLIEDEIYGTGLYPPQTIFQNVDVGFDVWLTAVNQVFKRKSLRNDLNAPKYFQLADEYPDNVKGYWSRTNYRLKEYENTPVYETVPSIEERDTHLENGMYFDGDIVRVLETDSTDGWDNQPVSTDYALVNGEWVNVGADNQTIMLLPMLYEEPDLLRRVYDEIKILLTEYERNTILFSVLYEMIRQNATCTWFLKTSYLNIHLSGTMEQSRFVRPNELDALVNNINDVKPYHSKLREKELILSIENQEDENADMEISDSSTTKAVLVFDRLSSNTIDDVYSYYDEIWGYSRPLWDLADLGREEWEIVGSAQGNNTDTVFEFTVDSSPNLYDQRLRMFLVADGTEVFPVEYDLTYSWITSGTKIVLQFNNPVSSLLRMEISQNLGFYEGGVTSSPYSGDYFHQAARMIEAGKTDEIVFGAVDDSEGAAPERVNTANLDHATILVRDFSPTEHDFAISTGVVPVVPVGIEIFDTSTEIVMAGETFVNGEHGYKIERVELDDGSTTVLVEDTDYTITFGSIVEFINPITPGDTIRIVYNGWPVGQVGTYEVTSTPGDIEIEGNYLYLDTAVVGDTISVSYIVERSGTAPLGLAVMPDYIVDDVLTNHLLYDAPLGMEINRRVGTRYANTTTKEIWSWDGSAWSLVVALAGTKIILSLRTGEVWRYFGGLLTKIYSVGDSLIGTPTFDYPEFGKGIGWGTEYWGTHVDAPTLYQAAYAVIQSTETAV